MGAQGSEFEEVELPVRFLAKKPATRLASRSEFTATSSDARWGAARHPRTKQERPQPTHAQGGQGPEPVPAEDCRVQMALRHGFTMENVFHVFNELHHHTKTHREEITETGGR